MPAQQQPPNPIHRELIGMAFIFLFVLTLVSLISYSPRDPSINHATQTDTIQNAFGWIGAHVSGMLIGLFGLASFWIPVIMLTAGLRQWRQFRPQKLPFTFCGGFLLIVSTAGLLSLHAHHINCFGRQFSSGGIMGIGLQGLLVNMANTAGAAFILTLLALIGLMLATQTALMDLFLRARRWLSLFFQVVKNRFTRWKQDRAAKSASRQPFNATKPKPTVVLQPDAPAAPRIEIKTSAPPVLAPPRPIKAHVPAPPIAVEPGQYQLPPLDFLTEPPAKANEIDKEFLQMQSRLLEEKLDDFGVRGKIVAVWPGPVITTFEYAPAPGIKINKIVGLSDDLALGLKAMSIRIVAPIPGKAVIGIEIPNVDREIVYSREIIASREFDRSSSPMTLCLGKDIVGKPVVAQLDKMPHLLIAGATGTGKSVGLNTMICSLLYKSRPDQVKFIMVDPKRIELSMYDDIPHLITPVVTDAKQATHALFWAVREMEHRYELLAHMRTRNIKQYNQKVRQLLKHPPKRDETEPSEAPETPELEELPYIVIIIDELADLMMVASKDVEVALMRLAQMARAAGLHLILATQRPSVDVLTGLIKANFPTRLSFQVSSKTDSRTIIDTNGAETLLGNGDMLFLPPGTAKLQRIHGAFIDEDEINRIIEFLKAQQAPDYIESVIEAPTEQKSDDQEIEYDERYDDAVALVTRTGQASISMVQRHLRIGYNRAARIIEVMEKEGVIGPADGAKPREVLAPSLKDVPEI